VLLLGQESLEEERFEDAVGWFEVATAISPDTQTAHACIGMCLDELGRLEEAADALDNALDLQPMDPVALYAQACVQAQLGDTEAALRHAATLVDAYPSFRDRLLEDEAFAHLQDHPRLLALVGAL
jgi:Flp pilus assembly protein TadD